MFTFFLTLLSYFIVRVLSDEAVVTLDANNFEEFIKSNPKVLVEFYAPWCGHCKQLAPEYERAATKIHEQEVLQTKLAKLDASDDKHKNIATKYGIRGFPTLKLFSNGDLNNPIAYNGGRKEADIVQWIEKRSLPALNVLKTKQDITAFKKRGLVLIAYLNDEKEQKTIEEFADAQRDSITVGVVTDESLITDDNIKFGTIYLHRKFDTPDVQYEGERPVTAATLENFLKAERFPLIDAISQENYKDHVDRGLPMVWIGIDGTNAENVDAVVAQVTPFASEWKGKLDFIWVDAIKYEKQIQQLGFTSIPGLIVIAGNKKFLYSGALDSKDDLKKFFSDYGDGKLQTHIRSQPVPDAKENEQPVYTLVGKTFNEVVGKDKDVFVEFYAPWCGHCKNLAPEYEKVGQAFSSVNSLVIAKIDATENDTPEEIKGFPTLIFYPKNSSQGVKYTGERTAKAIIDWLKTKASGDVSSVKTDL